MLPSHGSGASPGKAGSSGTGAARQAIIPFMEQVLDPESGETSSGEFLAPESSSRWLLRLARRALLVGLVLSLLVHIVGLAISARVFYGMGGSASMGADETPGLALTRGPELSDLMSGSIEISAPASGDLAAELKEVNPDQPLDVPRDPSLSQSENLEGSGSLSGAGNVSTDQGMGEGLGLGGGGGGASFFGVEATGSRFVFIVDVSGSMSLGGKIDALRGQLTRSIQNLVETSTFAVFTFSDDAAPLGNARDWTQAIEERKRWARKIIGTLTPGGATVPMNAFRAAFRLRPRPDAIYFMTDGEFDPSVADEIARLNTSRIPIHCIAFTSPESEQQMRRIATQSRGTYTFVPGARP
ncbi:MAG: VWA domain-containing protein [Phycisphaerae bacterium]|nr:VWA domain-containing protein [Phycisphaerae bacterium]